MKTAGSTLILLLVTLVGTTLLAKELSMNPSPLEKAQNHLEAAQSTMMRADTDPGRIQAETVHLLDARSLANQELAKSPGNSQAKEILSQAQGLLDSITPALKGPAGDLLLMEAESLLMKAETQKKKTAKDSSWKSLLDKATDRINVVGKAQPKSSTVKRLKNQASALEKDNTRQKK